MLFIFMEKNRQLILNKLIIIALSLFLFPATGISDTSSLQNSLSDQVIVACTGKCNDGADVSSNGTGNTTLEAIEKAVNGMKAQCLLVGYDESSRNCSIVQAAATKKQSVSKTVSKGKGIISKSEGLKKQLSSEGPYGCQSVNGPYICALICQNKGFQCYYQKHPDPECPDSDKWGCYCNNDC